MMSTFFRKRLDVKQEPFPVSKESPVLASSGISGGVVTSAAFPVRRTKSNLWLDESEKDEQDKEVSSLLVEKEKEPEGYWQTMVAPKSVSTTESSSVNAEANINIPPLYRGISSVGASLPKSVNKRKTLLLPQRKCDEGKLTVVLDMDETLIHSEFTGSNDYRQEEARLHVTGRRAPDFSIKLYENSPDQEEEIVHVYKRPGLDNFLKKLSQICEPVIFTAALPMYARPILKQIDPKRRCKSRLYRNATVAHRGYPHVKSLKSLGRDLSRVILVDNSPFAMCADPDNALPIKSYYDDQEDRELEYLYQIILEMVNADDVRPILRKKFNFAQTLNAIMDSN